MDTQPIKFEINGDKAAIFSYNELEGCTGTLIGEGIAFFRGTGDNRLHIANTQTGKIRKLSTAEGRLLVDDCEIDYQAIEKECAKGIHNAQAKAIRYSALSRWNDFKDGLCAISWMLYPDGCYFADSDGFGMDDNDEECVYAIIDTNLNIIEPFRPIDNIGEYLEKLRYETKIQQQWEL